MVESLQFVTIIRGAEKKERSKGQEKEQNIYKGYLLFCKPYIWAKEKGDRPCHAPESIIRTNRTKCGVSFEQLPKESVFRGSASKSDEPPITGISKLGLDEAQ